MLQKIEGISQPALGTENFNFVFTHKVSKSIGIWPCWYSSTFDAVGHASATVNLNPGPSWWEPATRHYLLRVLSRPLQGTPGRLTVTVTLPAPQLPHSVHDVTIDNTLSHPVDTQHSWTYPGFGCGALIRPQFSEAVLYSQAQTIAFQQATHDATGDAAAGRGGAGRGGADHQVRLHPADGERARLHAGRLHPPVVRSCLGPGSQREGGIRVRVRAGRSLAS